MDTAQTILAQLGGRKFTAMTGAYNYLDTGNGLQFAFQGCKALNRCRITLEPSDTYLVEFFKVGKFDYVSGPSREGVYAANLQTVFTAITDLETRL